MQVQVLLPAPSEEALLSIEGKGAFFIDSSNRIWYNSFKKSGFDGGQKVNDYHEDFWKAIDELVSTSKIVIDRPKGSTHPRFPDFIYRVDYGYLRDTSSMDGTGIDVWVGSGKKTVDAVMCIVDLMKRDSEIKILIGCTEEEKMEVYKTHNETQYMKGVLIRR